MKFVLLLIIASLLNVGESKGVMGHIVGKNHWQGAKYSMSWGQWLQANAQKGKLTKATLKSLMGTGLIDGSLMALEKITEKDGSGADSEWLKSLMVDDVLSMRFRDMGIVAGIVGIDLVIISMCGVCLKMKCKNDQKGKGEWRWERMTKAEGERKYKEEEVKEMDKGDDLEMEDRETAV